MSHRIQRNQTGSVQPVRRRSRQHWWSMQLSMRSKLGVQLSHSKMRVQAQLWLHGRQLWEMQCQLLFGGRVLRDVSHLRPIQLQHTIVRVPKWIQSGRWNMPAEMHLNPNIRYSHEQLHLYFGNRLVTEWSVWNMSCWPSHRPSHQTVWPMCNQSGLREFKRTVRLSDWTRIHQREHLHQMRNRQCLPVQRILHHVQERHDMGRDQMRLSSWPGVNKCRLWQSVRSQPIGRCKWSVLLLSHQ